MSALLIGASFVLVVQQAFAASTAPGGPVARWPMIVAWLVIALIGFGMSRLSKMWEELTTSGRVMRVVGIVVSSLAVFMLAFAATEAPPVRTSGDALPWIKDYESAKKSATSRQVPLLLDFTAVWCNACHELEAEVFQQEEVAKRLKKDFVLLKVDFDKNTKENRALLAKFEVSGLPRVAFESTDGTFLKGPSFEGKLTKEEFVKKLDMAKSGVSSAQKSDLARALEEGRLFAALLLVFFAGLLSSLTPCVYPLIPITISLFGARETDSKLQGFLLSLAYVMGIAVTYSLLGVAAASFGTVFGGLMQSVWVLVGISVLFFVLGLGSLEVFSFQLPGGLQTRLSQRWGAGYVGAFSMGLVAGIIAAPCVGPIVAGILLYVAQAQDVFLGWILLMTFSLGMGVLFLVLGTFSSLLTKIPRSGSWMVGVKSVFGAIFFGMALYYLRYVIEPLRAFAQSVWLMLA